MNDHFAAAEFCLHCVTDSSLHSMRTIIQRCVACPAICKAARTSCQAPCARRLVYHAAVPTRKPQRQSPRHDGRPRYTFRQLGIRNFAAKRHRFSLNRLSVLRFLTLRPWGVRCIYGLRTQPTDSRPGMNSTLRLACPRLGTNSAICL